MLLFLCLIFIECSKEDDFSIDIYTVEDLNMLHNNNFKEWELEAYYIIHNNRLSEQNDCFIDDRYIFKKDSEIEVISGTESCYYGTDEIAEAKLTFYEEQGTIWFTMIRGKISNNVVSSTSFSLKLIELKPDRMVFASGDKRDYKTALIFVKK